MIEERVAHLRAIEPAGGEPVSSFTMMTFMCERSYSPPPPNPVAMIIVGWFVPLMAHSPVTTLFCPVSLSLWTMRPIAGCSKFGRLTITSSPSALSQIQSPKRCERRERKPKTPSCG